MNDNHVATSAQDNSIVVIRYCKPIAKIRFIYLLNPKEEQLSVKTDMQISRIVILP